MTPARTAVISILFAVVLLMAGVSAVGIGMHVARANGTVITFITGKSMEPLLHAGDLMVVDSKAEPDVGDVMVFYTGEGVDSHLVCHRAMSYSYAESTGWVTKGDNNNSADSWLVRNRDVVGVMASVYPHMGWMASLTLPFALMLMVVAVVCMFLLALAVMIWSGRVEVTFPSRQARMRGDCR